MSAEYMHIGIPITNRKPGMTYNEGAKFWVSNVDDYDYKIEYLKFEEGTPFPEAIHRNPHVAYKVDNLEKYIADADSVICGWIRNETGSPASVRITVARESDPDFHHVETINGVPSEEGEGVFFSWEIDWEAYVSDRYLVTAQVLDGDTWKSLSGTYLYDRSEGEGIRLEQPEEASETETASYIKGEYLGTFSSSAYCSCTSCSGGHARTYSGTIPKENHTVAADLAYYPIGTKLMVDGTVYTVEDMGSGVVGNHLDFYFDTHAEALAYGMKDVEVYAVIEAPSDSQ